jgi:hypothetical protein
MRPAWVCVWHGLHFRHRFLKLAVNSFSIFFHRFFLAFFARCVHVTPILHNESLNMPTPTAAHPPPIPPLRWGCAYCSLCTSLKKYACDRRQLLSPAAAGLSCLGYCSRPSVAAACAAVSRSARQPHCMALRTCVFCAAAPPDERPSRGVNMFLMGGLC